MSRYIIYTLLITLMAASIAVIDSRNVEYVPPTAESQGHRIYATGIVEGETEAIQLSPEIQGRVVEVLVSVGDWVEAGALLLRLDDRRQTQQVAVSQAQLDLALAQLQRLTNGVRKQEKAEARALLMAKQARLNQALSTWNRIQRLRDQAVVTQQEIDDQKGEVDALAAQAEAAQSHLEQLEAPARLDELGISQARVATAEATLELAKLALEKTRLLASQRGQVLDRNVELGELLGAVDSAPAIVLSDTSQLRVRAFVEEIDAPKLQIGMPAQITADGLPGQVFAGHIVSLSPRMQAKTMSSGNPSELYDTKVREVLLEVEDSQGLLVGLRVDVMFFPAGPKNDSKTAAIYWIRDVSRRSFFNHHLLGADNGNSKKETNLCHQL